MQSCKRNSAAKVKMIDSLKDIYANMPIHINFDRKSLDNNKELCFYFSRNLKDTVGKLSKIAKYRVSISELHSSQTRKFYGTEPADFVLIEGVGSQNERLSSGFVPYAYIKEFEAATRYDE